MTRPWCSLSTLRSGPYWPPRKTRFRWLARPYRVGLATHRVAMKGFKDATPYPPFLSFAWRNGSSCFSIRLAGKNDRRHFITCFRQANGPGREEKRSRVERWRGGLGQAQPLPALSSAGVSLAWPCSVSTSRSSNRTCRFPASGSPTGFGPVAHGAACPPHLRPSPSSFRRARIVGWR